MTTNFALFTYSTITNYLFMFCFVYRIDNNNVSVFGPASIAQRLIFAAAAAAAAAPKVI
jgi:hypothetical protein